MIEDSFYTEGGGRKFLTTRIADLWRYFVFVKRWRYFLSVIFYIDISFHVIPRNARQRGTDKQSYAYRLNSGTEGLSIQHPCDHWRHLLVPSGIVCLVPASGCRVTVCTLLSKYCVRMWSHDVFKRRQAFRHRISRIPPPHWVVCAMLREPLYMDGSRQNSCGFRVF
jgi:hypothetical protein